MFRSVPYHCYQPLYSGHKKPSTFQPSSGQCCCNRLFVVIACLIAPTRPYQVPSKASRTWYYYQSCGLANYHTSKMPSSYSWLGTTVSWARQCADFCVFYHSKFTHIWLARVWLGLCSLLVKGGVTWLAYFATRWITTINTINIINTINSINSVNILIVLKILILLTVLIVLLISSISSINSIAIIYVAVNWSPDNSWRYLPPLHLRSSV